MIYKSADRCRLQIVTKYNYDPAYKLRDELLLRLLKSPNEYHEIWDDSVEVTKANEGEFWAIKYTEIAKYIDRTRTTHAKISPKGVSFIKAGGYKALMVKSDEEIVYRYLAQLTLC